MPSINGEGDGQAAKGVPGRHALPLADERASVSRAAHVLAVMTAISRVAGLFRDAAIGAVFGTGAGADAFFVAFRIPNLMRRLVAEGATSAAFVPVLTERLASGGESSALKAAGAVGGAAFVVLAVLTVAGMAFSGVLTSLFAPGFSRDAAKQALTVSLTCWTFPYLLLVGLAAWAMGVHHTFRRFALPAIGPVMMNVAIIAFALLVAPRLETPSWALVAGVVVGGAAQLAVQVPSLWRLGLRPSMFANFSDAAVRRCGRLVAAAVVGGSVYQLSVLVATMFASLLPPGTVSYLWYADRVFEFPLGIVAVAVGTAALPSLSSQAAARHLDGMAETVIHAMGLTIAFCLPAAVGLVLLSDDITALLFERGSFAAHDTAMTAWALRASVPGLLGVGLVRVLSAAFFAIENTRVPVLSGILSLFLGAVLSIALMGPVDPGMAWWGAGALSALSHTLGVADYRHAGLSLATGLSSTANAVVLLVLLRKALPGLRLGMLARPVLRHAVAATVMAAFLMGWKALAASWSFEGALAVRVAGGIAGGSAIYLAVAALLGSAEILELLAAVRRAAEPPPVAS
ncbi:MAG TPA: murein biosynthesis integral membrane protein MurJ [Candidatus Limnocylindrales bacterium]|nr:murein biosynthesis integral membrane protein MurJ [Candidatus Limnocylindrales bacterium]